MNFQYVSIFGTALCMTCVSDPRIDGGKMEKLKRELITCCISLQDFGEFMKSNRLAPWPKKKGQANVNVLEKSKSI
jgi:tellurite resistance protein